MELAASIFADCIHVLKFLVIGNWVLALKKRENTYIKYIIAILTVFFSVLIYGTREYSIPITAAEYLLFVWILFYGMYEEKFWKICLIGIWMAFLLAMFDSMASVIVDLSLDVFQLKSKYISNILASIITLGFVMIVGVLLKKKNRIGISGVHYLYLIGFTMITVANNAALAVLENVIINSIDIERKLVLVVVFVVIVIGIFVQMGMLLLLIVSRNTHLEREALMEKYLNEQNQHYGDLEQRERETKKFRHDLRNHMYLLRIFCKNGDYEELDTYIEKLEGRIENFGSKISVNNNMADAILNKYHTEAAKKRIRLTVEGHFPVKVNIGAFDLCTILSNLLSNAIEAEEKCGGTEVQISFRYNAHEILILVENDYIGELLYDEDRIKTQKEDQGSHGFGLENVKECVNCNGGYMDIQTDNHRFKVILSLLNEMGDLEGHGCEDENCSSG